MKSTIKKKILRGFATAFAFLGSFVYGAYGIAAGADYKTTVDDFLGVESSGGGGNVSEYAFNSDYNDTKELLSARADVASRLAEEGCVLLKNNGALPLRKGTENDTIKATLLGSRAYTFSSDGKLRDTEDGKMLSVYGGAAGSTVVQQKVVTKDGTLSLPITLEMGLKEENIEINPKVKKAYDGKKFSNYVKGNEAEGDKCGPFSAGEPSITKSECGDTHTDVCFVFLGRASGEGRDYFPGDNGIVDGDGATCALGLYDSERALINLAAEISHKVVVLLNSAVAMEIDELKEGPLADKVDSVLWIGLPGAYGMRSVAQVISGKKSPSGKLPDIYEAAASYSPAAQNFGVSSQDGTAFAWSNEGDKSIDWITSRKHYVVLAEGLYTGYRYYETRYADTVYGKGSADSVKGTPNNTAWKYEDVVAYSFGYGLSYSTFEERMIADSLHIDLTKKTVSVDVVVKNTGDITAKHVVQLYAQAPYTDYDIEHGVEKSAIQLMNFKKVELEPNEEKTVTITADLKYLASYDKTVQHSGKTGGYILDAGVYYFAIGNGAHEALNNALAKQDVETDKLYHETGASINANGAVSWDTETESAFVTNNGINSTLFERTTEKGALVENQIADGDYNYYVPDTITYLTRNDWDGTFPEAYTDLKVLPEMVDALNNKVYKFDTSKHVETEFGYDHSDDLDENDQPMENMTISEMKLKSFEDESWDYLLDQVTFYEAWFLAPYGGKENEAISSVASPIAWQMDGPNGNNSYMLGQKAKKSGPYAISKSDPNYEYWTRDMPCEPMIAATFNQELLKEEGKIFGEDMIWNGCAMVWAPGMNLHRVPFNSRNHEYYSEDPMLTNLCGTAFVEGGLEKGGLLAAKHFAFNTQESFREGLCQFMEEQSARELELRGFEGVAEDATFINSQGNEVHGLGVMTSFSRVGVYSVNAHTGVMKNILRGEWNFKGLSSSDMVFGVGGAYFTPQDAIINNVTFLATTGPEFLLSQYWSDWNNRSMVAQDAEMCKALRENMHYYLYAIANSTTLNGVSADYKVVDEMSWWQPVLLGVSGGCVGFAALLGVLSFVVAVKGDKKKGGKKHA